MNKKPNLIIRIMALIGVIATGICLCIIFRDRIKETFLFKKFFAEEEDDELFFPDEDLPEIEEETAEETDVAEAEEEKPAPKARRGYTSLKL